MKKALVLFIGFICYQIICHAQVMDEHYYFKNLSVQNGLSQNTVNAILQDKQGFMWFGTKDGLNRYDGLSFRKFKHDGRSQQSIGNSFITALYEDAEGNILVGDHVNIDTTNTISFSSGKMIATIGVDNLVVVETEDAILVCDKNRVQDVKKVVDTLNEQGRTDLL